MLRSGNTAFRTREWMEVLGRKLGFDQLSVGITLDSIVVTGRRGTLTTTLVREIGPPGVDAARIGALENLAVKAEPGLAPKAIATSLAEIESRPPLYGIWRIGAAVGPACGGFAFLNGCGLPEIIAATLGGGIGQSARLLLARRRLNQHFIAAVCAVIATAGYLLVAAVIARLGFGTANHPGGLISSILFLAPGFPLVAAQLDLVQYQTAAALTRLVYGVMLFLAATFGLSIVIGITGTSIAQLPGIELAYPLKLLLRAVASFVGGCAFAMAFNCPSRSVWSVGIMAALANVMRLGLHDAGMMLAPATFFGALAVGLMASLVHRRLNVPRITLTVPGIIIMVPGVFAFEMIVFFNRGQMLEALQASASCAFVLGAMAMGLAAARLAGAKPRASL
ncbi:MAG: threonine/serine exporter family protein [Xanthobacteraceae bacterium]|nr:threonine/serine exporter family protein [Xanthobacteraceae bacterium]